MEAAAVPPVILNALFQLLDLLFAIPRQCFKPSRIDSSFQLIDTAHTQRFPHQGNTLGTHPGQPQHFQHRGFVAGQEFIAQLHASMRDHLCHIRSHAFADAWNGQQAFRIIDQGGKLNRALLDCLGCPPVGANTESIAAADLQQVCCFAQELGYGSILHGAS